MESPEVVLAPGAADQWLCMSLNARVTFPPPLFSALPSVCKITFSLGRLGAASTPRITCLLTYVQPETGHFCARNPSKNPMIHYNKASSSHVSTPSQSLWPGGGIC